MKKPEEAVQERKLVLFTQRFPFEGESFLETELPYLEAAFDEVLIVASATDRRATQTVSVGAHTQICRLTRPSWTLRKWVWAVWNGITHINGELLRELRGQKGIKKKLATVYYNGRYRVILRKAWPAVDRFVGVDSHQMIALYSFWFLETAQVATEFAMRFAKRGICCRTYTRAHRHDLYEWTNACNSFPFRESTIEKLDAVFPCSVDGKHYLDEHYPAFTDKIFTRYLGTIDRGLNPEGRNGAYVIVTCSNIITVKRLCLLAEAVLQYEAIPYAPEVKWCCIGDGDELAKLQEVTQQFARTEFDYVGRLSNEDVLRWYADNHVDLFVNTSSSEGLPVSIMEACSFGIPVLATDVGGTGEIVCDGDNGMLVPADVEPSKLADSLYEFITSSAEIQQRYRRRAREIWQEKFNADNNYHRFAEAL